jgi:hypothetical protein
MVTDALKGAGLRLSVAAAHVRRCRRRLCWRRWLRRDSGLTRCSRGRFRLAGAGNQHQSQQRKCGTQYECFFHSSNRFFKDRFVTSGFARRIRAQNSSFLRNVESVILLTVRHTRRVLIFAFCAIPKPLWIGSRSCR